MQSSNSGSCSKSSFTFATFSAKSLNEPNKFLSSLLTPVKPSIFTLGMSLSEKCLSETSLKTFVIRSANQGISAFISPNGKTLKSLGPNDAGNIEIELPILKKNYNPLKKSLIFFILLITFVFTFLVLKKFKI